MFAFTFGLVFSPASLFGLAPAWQATSPKLAVTLKDHAGNVSAVGGHVRIRKALVVSQVTALAPDADRRSTLCPVAANLNNIDLGFRRERLLSFMRSGCTNRPRFVVLPLAAPARPAALPPFDLIPVIRWRVSMRRLAGVRHKTVVIELHALDFIAAEVTP